MALPISILKNILDFKGVHIEKIELNEKAEYAYGKTHIQKTISVYARPYKRLQCQCPVCMNKCVRNGHKQSAYSYWRASNLNGIPVFIYYQPQRIFCPEHGALNEYIPWADGTSRFTAAFNDEVAWMSCQMPKSAICEYQNINWRTVGNCIKASHARLEPDVSLRIHDNVRRICVDETSYQKGHKYITVVYDMDKNKVIWVHKDHGQNIFEKFCLQLTAEERSKIEIVAGDGAQWIDSCVREYFPNATRCVDFFHVVQWANDALDEVRRKTAAKAKKEYNSMKKEFIKAETEAAEAAAKAEEAYNAAVIELDSMPRCSRPGKRHMELLKFIMEYEKITASKNEEPAKRNAGRPKKEQFTPEHEAVLTELYGAFKDVKGSRYALGHNPDKCTDAQKDKLKLIETSYPDLYRAYQIKETLRCILHMSDAALAEHELTRWINDALTSKLAPMTELAEKIERHKDNILNSVKHKANSAKSEATNTTIKALIKIARGFRNLDNMFALIYLKCSDIIIPLCNRKQPDNEYLKNQRNVAMERKRARMLAAESPDLFLDFEPRKT